MRAADVAGLLKDFAVDVREFVAKSVAKVEERFAAIEQRLQDAPAPITAAEVDHAVDEKIDRAFVDLMAPRLDPVLERLSIIEERAATPGPQGDAGPAGPRGEAGERGADGAQGERGADGADGVAGERGEPGQAGEPGDRGLDGKPGERGSDGAPGERGEPGAQGERGMAGERGLDGAPGKDVDEDALQARIDAAVEKAIAAAMAALVLPKDGIDGKDGQDVDAEEVQRRVDASVDKALAAAVAALPAPTNGVDGKDGMKGEDGRDAYQIDVLDDIDAERSYPRGTHARWRGGVIRAFRATDPPVDGVPIEKLGWACLIDGIHELTPEATDDPRRFTLRASTTSGKMRTLQFSVPTPIWRGVWSERSEYVQGDQVTYDGSQWHCERPTKAKPGTQTSTPDWKLCVKRGRDGRDGDKGPKGDKGDKGHDGRDLTQLGWDGAKT